MISLPPKVTAAQWALERINQQNPCIRAFLGSIRLLEGVLESNYAILHCSPERLLDIWGKVLEVSELLRTQIAPLLEKPSCIPRLEEARRRAEVSLRILEDQVLSRHDRLPRQVPPERLMELRKLLCVSIGQLHAYLQETFGELMAADPRSVHDADYFLSRRFPRDIEEAEWLLATVERLRDYLRGLARSKPSPLLRFTREMGSGEKLPEPKVWQEMLAFLEGLIEGLVPRLHELLALRGIRFDEMEILDRYSAEIPADCRHIEELYAAARELLLAIEAVEGPTTEELRQAARAKACCHVVFSSRIVRKLEEMDQRLQDLEAFLPLWLDNISKRRALMFRKSETESA